MDGTVFAMLYSEVASELSDGKINSVDSAIETGICAHAPNTNSICNRHCLVCRKRSPQVRNDHIRSF